MGFGHASPCGGLTPLPAPVVDFGMPEAGFDDFGGLDF
jgi:hypothetical protein